MIAQLWVISLLNVFKKQTDVIIVGRGLFCVLTTSHSFFLSLEVELEHCVVDIMPCGSPVHLPPRGVTWDRSYIYMDTSSPNCYSGSLVHVTPKLKDVHYLFLFTE